MDFSEKKLVNLFFKIAITTCIAGIVFYFIQELTYLMKDGSEPYNIILGIADFLGIFALIAITLWLFIPQLETIFLNIAIIIGSVFILSFTFAHFFAPKWFLGVAQTNYLLENFQNTGLSFIGLLLISIFSIGTIVIFTMKLFRQGQMYIFEKFGIILWLIFIAIFDFTNFYIMRQLAFDAVPFLQNIGVSFIPSNYELIFISFAAILLVLDYFMAVNKKVIYLLTLFLLNAITFTYVIGTISIVGFTFVAGQTPVIMGHFLIIIGTIMLAFCTYFVLASQYTKSTAKK